jgi:hypothetical protein
MGDMHESEALMLALQHGRKEEVELLLLQGAGIHSKHKGG